MTAELRQAFAEGGITEVDVFFAERDDIGVVLSRTLDKDSIRSSKEALIEIYRKLRPGDPPTLETATNLFRGMFFDPRKYDFSRVGRLKFNIKMGLDTPLDNRTLDAPDFVSAIKYLFKLRKNIGVSRPILMLNFKRPPRLKSYLRGSKNMPRNRFVAVSSVGGSPGRSFLEISMSASFEDRMASLSNVRGSTKPISSPSGENPPPPSLPPPPTSPPTPPVPL